jgi:hypothetical protein
LTPKKRAAFLDKLREGATVKQAAEAAGFSRQAFYALRSDNHAFAEEWARAIDEGTEVLEAEAFRRAVVGIEDVKMIGSGDNAEVVHFLRYSDTLLIFLLKARRPEKYRDSIAVKTGDHDGGPIEVRLAFDPT